MDKAELTANVNELTDQVAAATDLRRYAEEEVSCLKEALRAKEADKLLFLQKLQEFTIMVDCWRSTMVKSADECFGRLKIELNATMVGSFQQAMQVH